MTRARRLALVAAVLVVAALNTGAVRRFLNDIEVLGTLEVAGETTLGGAVSASGALDLEGPVSASRTFTVDPGALDVHGSARFRGLASADRTFSVSDLSASGGLQAGAPVEAPGFVLSGEPKVQFRFYSKTLSSGEVSWDVAGDGFASVAGVVATVKSTGGGGGGGGGGGPQVVADASDPQALTGVGGTEDYALAFINAGGTGIALFFPSSMTVADLAALFGISTGGFDFASNDGSFTSSPGPVFVNGGAGNDNTWDNTPLDDSTVGSISTSPGSPTLTWNGSAYEATYAEWTLGATTYENTATGGPPTVDSYFFLAAGGGGGGGGGIPALGWSVDGTTVTVTDGSGSSGDDVSVVVWGEPE